MQPRLQNDEIISAILKELSESACSVEYRDHYDKLSVRLFNSEGVAFFTTEDMPLRPLRDKNKLTSRIAHWKSLLDLQLVHSSSRDDGGPTAH